MTFQELLNDYLTQLDCTARELSAASGISAPVISRYRRGTQSPEPMRFCLWKSSRMAM